MRKHSLYAVGRAVLLMIACLCIRQAWAEPGTVAGPQVLSQGWVMQDAAKVAQGGAEISGQGYDSSGWYRATVPGTVLTTLVNNKIYPEPLYGENNRPNVIPESLARTSYWYRTVAEVPETYKGRRTWLNFDGINYSATVWVNGAEVGGIRGAFSRGIFDITGHVEPGKRAVIAVLVNPQPHPGISHEHTIRDGLGPNGGESAIDGPTFLSTIGWDWLPAIRDRDTGIWQKVFLSATGSVVIRDPLVTTDLPLPRTDEADVSVQATVENVSDVAVSGALEGQIEDIHFRREIEIAPHTRQLVRFDPKDTPALQMKNPRLWWPNGYGAQNLYKLHLSFTVPHDVLDAQDVQFGVRKVTYSVPDSDNLTISVNGVRIFIRGGDCGLDEAMKRIPRERLEAQIRLHKAANLNMIRNWVGQSTGEDFYELCDKYGLLVWDEFFQPNPSDGPNPTDIQTYIANVREKILRFRNHPSIVLWCARNEGDPPPEIDRELRKLMAELEPTRMYQPSSTEGHGVRSHGPYCWRTPREFYRIDDDPFKTETGSVSIPTLESIHGMMPAKDWETINDDWAEHDLAHGNSGGDVYPLILVARYGKLANLPDFVRKGQLANYEAFRAMYEGRNAQLFHPTTAVLTWMSNPAQPSFVWQIYHYDLEPNSAFYAVMHASEMVHIQLNEENGILQVVNNRPVALAGARAHVAIYDLGGALVKEQDIAAAAPASSVANLGPVEFPASLRSVRFLKLELKDEKGQLISGNFYWLGSKEHPDDFTALETMPKVMIDAKAECRTEANVRTVTVTLHNPTKNIALMAHLQLRRGSTGDRVLPAYASDNYVSLVPNETRTIRIEAEDAAFHHEDALVMVDGWNVTAAKTNGNGCGVAPNLEAQPDQSAQGTFNFPMPVSGR